jgi:hypothetical protein
VPSVDPNLHDRFFLAQGFRPMVNPYEVSALGADQKSGEFADWLPIPYHFDYFVGNERIGGLERILGVRDRYRLDVSGNGERQIDRRLVLALAVRMDALQAR